MIKKQSSIGILIILLAAALIITGCDILPSPGRSDDASLSALRTNKGTLDPIFKAETVNYNIFLTETVSSFTVTPTAANPDATITVNYFSVVSGTASEPISLAEGINTTEIIVTAKDKSTTKIYTILTTVVGVNITGTLTLTNSEDASGKDFQLILTTDTDTGTAETASITGIWTSGSTQGYQLTEIPPGTYYLYTLIDWDDDGDFDQAYPDYTGFSGYSFNSLSAGGTPTGPANIIVTSDSDVIADITDIQQMPDP